MYFRFGPVTNWKKREERGDVLDDYGLRSNGVNSKKRMLVKEGHWAESRQHWVRALGVGVVHGGGRR